MVSRKRVLRLGTTIAERATTKRARAIAQILLLASLAFVGLRVRSLWHGNHIDLGSVEWGAIAGAVVLGAGGTAAGAFIWLAILYTLGVKTERRWLSLFFQAQLGKYIPGSVWQYAGRAAVSRAHGIPARQLGLSLPIEFIASALAAGSVVAFLLGWWGVALVVAVALLLLGTMRVVGQRRPLAFATARGALLYIPSWLVLGASFWLCARGLAGAPSHDLAFYTGAFAMAWLAGLLAVYAPGGLGVREAVLVALLSSRIGAADALVVAAASRLILIGVDVVLAGLATMALRRGRARLDAADPA
jgi:glycosyltransferase 2 family protein